MSVFSIRTVHGGQNGNYISKNATQRHRVTFKAQAKYLQPASAMINRSGCHMGPGVGAPRTGCSPRANAANVCLVYQSIYSGRLSLWNRDSRLREGCLHPLQGKGWGGEGSFFTDFIPSLTSPLPGKIWYTGQLWQPQANLTPKKVNLASSHV